MPMFRKKPVEVEAVLFDNVGNVYDFVGENMTQPLGGKVGIITLEGTMWASPGDWIIKGVNGEFYPCKPDIFEKTYDPA
ncbi:hypothetical protein BK124_11515 [Paenibacillus amylolyticus]|uniref:hypothetical protein n=1 Tax=Paenibacillus amylolyticus TaxID=1451 RepID=UPI00096E61E1|nr:hypothetical protein [Paenibacillus amylolyticus]OMF00278.1 hypothetical protein BK124_11515 [Paenibacillus amylolyticus]